MKINHQLAFRKISGETLEMRLHSKSGVSLKAGLVPLILSNLKAIIVYTPQILIDGQWPCFCVLCRCQCYEMSICIYGMKRPLANTETEIKWQLEPFYPISILGHGR